MRRGHEQLPTLLALLRRSALDLQRHFEPWHIRRLDVCVWHRVGGLVHKRSQRCRLLAAPEVGRGLGLTHVGGLPSADKPVPIDVLTCCRWPAELLTDHFPNAAPVQVAVHDLLHLCEFLLRPGAFTSILQEAPPAVVDSGATALR